MYNNNNLTLGTIFISVTFLPSLGPTFLNLKCRASSACREDETMRKKLQQHGRRFRPRVQARTHKVHSVHRKTTLLLTYRVRLVGNCCGGLVFGPPRHWRRRRRVRWSVFDPRRTESGPLSVTGHLRRSSFDREHARSDGHGYWLLDFARTTVVK